MSGFDNCTKKEAIINDGKTKLGDYFIIDSNSIKGFNFGYVVFIPNEIDSNTTLIVEGANTGESFEDIDMANKDILDFATSVCLPIYYIASKLKMPILIPLFPRVRLNNKTLYTHMLSSDVLKIEDGPFKRIDNQLIYMFKDAKERFSQSNIILNEKFVINGFSASSKFANRFTLLHPEMISLCIGGGISGTLSLPLREINGETLLYPLGIGNIDEYTKEKYEQFIKVKQFYYMGLQDDNDPFAHSPENLSEPKHPNIISKEEMEQLHRILGSEMTTKRWETSQAYYNNLGVNVEFATYKEFGHMPHPATDKIIELLEDVKNIAKQR